MTLTSPPTPAAGQGEKELTMADTPTPDLAQFCWHETGRDHIQKPWSRGGFSYATNGHILVRVPRRADVPEEKKAPDAERVITQSAQATQFFPLLVSTDLPAPSTIPCRYCEGSGKDKFDDLPCDECDGVGSNKRENPIAVGGACFAPTYIKMIAALPSPEMAVGRDIQKPHAFRFDGGIGCLMGMRADPDTVPMLKPNGFLARAKEPPL